ncbi:hypothetical protein LOTGIDRAFT_133609 [Lottia gigantea]|uniref:SRP54-type proteins GTP-binding domain-containing protein n=1 Tax=Lottia gigantea TaxID=225164 RepID=V3ZLU0_LOTGI|nr:hypothetical protein LOTGIDRAFT_133609 [Lottia gigantea]ESO83355.1 hypothetical protein LOTGIDRAFT_133609 [Lottia gigantea]
MLDFFSVFSKGGIVLWCFQGTSQLFTPSVNALIKSVILQERSGSNTFNHDKLILKYKLDNEFELVFVVAYQNIAKLSYVDKFLTDIQIEFRNRYKNVLQHKDYSANFDFNDSFHGLLRLRERESEEEARKPKQMKTYEESNKSKKSVSSMIENKKDNNKKPAKGKEKNSKSVPSVVESAKTNGTVDTSNNNNINNSSTSTTNTNGELDEETIMKNRMKLFNKGKKPKSESPKSPKVEEKKKGKKATKWDMGGTSKDFAELDYCVPNENGQQDETIAPSEAEVALVGKMSGSLQDIEVESNKSGGFGMFNMFKNLVGSKALTKEDVAPALDKMRDHLIAKNVAADIAQNLCDSVAVKLEGKVLGTFSRITTTVKATLQDSCVQLLAPKRRIDILRDAMDCRSKKRPYVITFCGVNGVGKSTNLAKICFWLIENGFRVLIAACDTFRAGAVEQLRTHVRKLNSLHPPEAHNGQRMVELYEKGYGKDAAGIALEAINHARDRRIDVVLVDTAGRMQDNEPLMRALAKLIKLNQPDLVLFVGEALVGNEAVDQLTRFNQALADHSNMTDPRLIDGIILSKFDTIDDKVGAAISMTYTTGQPIVFVGTGQTYTDLRNLNAKAVVNALLKA